ncbi:MAG: hypothetical protein U0795_13160 [Pirellulales bacterium]
MNKTFRLRKSIQYQALGFLALFGIALIGGAASILRFVDAPQEGGFRGEWAVWSVAGLWVGVFSLMVMLSLYILRAYYVEQFSMQGKNLWVRSVLQNARFHADELQQLKWRPFPQGGSILFRLLGSRVRLDLHGFSRADRLEIVRALRTTVPMKVQQGWEQFSYYVAVPLRDGRLPQPPNEVEPKRVLIQRSRYDRLLMVALPLSLTVAIGLGVAWNLWKGLVLPPVVLGLWALLRYTVPREGAQEVPVTSSNQGRMLCGTFLGYFACLATMIGMGWMGFNRDMACGAALVVFAIFVAPVFLRVMPNEFRKVREGIELAPGVWEAGEAASEQPDSRSATQ